MNKTKAVDVSIHDVLAVSSVPSAKTKQLTSIAETPVIVGINLFMKYSPPKTTKL